MQAAAAVGITLPLENRKHAPSEQALFEQGDVEVIEILAEGVIQMEGSSSKPSSQEIDELKASQDFTPEEFATVREVCLLLGLDPVAEETQTDGTSLEEKSRMTRKRRWNETETRLTNYRDPSSPFAGEATLSIQENQNNEEVALINNSFK
jgi:hypothetical protein